MTRIEKIIRIARVLEHNVITENVKRLLLKAEAILDVAYTSDDDDTSVATFNGIIEPKEVPLTKSRSKTINRKDDWGARRVVTKSDPERKDLIARLRKYSQSYGFNEGEIFHQAKRQGYDIRKEDIIHWFKGHHLPSDYKFSLLTAFLDKNDKKNIEVNEPNKA